MTDEVMRVAARAGAGVPRGRKGDAIKQARIINRNGRRKLCEIHGWSKTFAEDQKLAREASMAHCRGYQHESPKNRNDNFLIVWINQKLAKNIKCKMIKTSTF